MEAIFPSQYELLYAKYLDPIKLFRFLHQVDYRDKRVLDLCCGTGVVGLEALWNWAAEVVFVDELLAMINHVCKKIPTRSKFQVSCSSVQTFLFSLPPDYGKFDIVLCRQAVNYWLDAPILLPSAALRHKNMAQAISEIIVPGGYFYFNTFAQKPLSTPTVKQYDLLSRHYVEISWLAGDMVYHVQIVDNEKPHFTEFRWIPKERFVELLEPFFDITIQETKRTLDFKCKKL